MMSMSGSDNDYKPKLIAVSNTRNSITLSWNAPPIEDKIIYKVQVKEKLWGWTTKYWPSAIDCYDSNGKTPLMKCAQQGNASIASMLLGAGASTNMQSIPSRSTALMIACWFGHLQTVTLLHENNADWGIRDNHGCTALHHAVDNSQVDIIKFAIECGANIEEKDDNGWTPLLRGVYLMSETHVLSVLINHGAEVNVCDARGQTPLMQAVIAGQNNLSAVKVLLLAGADLRAFNKYNHTVLQMANAYNDNVVIEELISSLEKDKEDTDDKNSETKKESERTP